MLYFVKSPFIQQISNLYILIGHEFYLYNMNILRRQNENLNISYIVNFDVFQFRVHE